MYKLATIDLDGTMLNQYGVVTQNTKDAIKRVTYESSKKIMSRVIEDLKL